MKRLAKSESDSSSTLLRRRDFLTLGSAGLLAPLFGNLAWAEPLAAAAERSAQTVPMSVGYIDGSEEYRSFKRLPRKIRRPLLLKEEEEAETSPVIIPAESLFQADTSLPGRPLRIHVHGLYPPVALEAERRREVPLAVDLEAVFPSPDRRSPRRCGSTSGACGRSMVGTPARRRASISLSNGRCCHSSSSGSGGRTAPTM